MFKQNKDLYNRYINENNQQFSDLVDLVGGEYDEKNLADLVMSLYEYSRQLPFPEKWYDLIVSLYNGGKFSSENLWYQYAFTTANDIIDDLSLFCHFLLLKVFTQFSQISNFLISQTKFIIQISLGRLCAGFGSALADIFQSEPLRILAEYTQLFLYPIKYSSISCAQARPSARAQTTRLCPRRMSPAE